DRGAGDRPRPAGADPVSSAADSLALDSRVAEYLLARGASGRRTVAVAALSGDASTRRYFRVHEETGPRVIALYPEPFVAAELSFAVVRELFGGWGLPGPAVLAQGGEQGSLEVQVHLDLPAQ